VYHIFVFFCNPFVMYRIVALLNLQGWDKKPYAKVSPSPLPPPFPSRVPYQETSLDADVISNSDELVVWNSISPIISPNTRNLQLSGWITMILRQSVSPLLSLPLSPDCTFTERLSVTDESSLNDVCHVQGSRRGVNRLLPRSSKS
jgi:hypothetical protein